MGQLDTAIGALSVAVAARVPVLLWGSPGTGKTSIVRSLADGLGWRCETVIASIREPSDFAGLPVIADPKTAAWRPGGEAPSADGLGTPQASPRDDNFVTHVDFVPPRWARRLAEDGRGVLFLDEISTAPPAVQAALLRVVLERTVGDLTLPAGVAVVGAANPPEESADGWDLSPPLANRFCHLDWPVDPAAVSSGFVGGFPPVVTPDLDPAWETAILPGVSGSVAGFLVARPSLTCVVPTEASRAGRGWPSPRSWEMTARLVAAARSCASPPEVVAALVVGCVGEGTGLEFLAWLDELDLPDPERLLADPESFVLPERGDRALAALSAVCAVVVATPSVDRWLAAWRVLGVAARTSPDVAAVAARTLSRHRPPGAPVPPEIEAFAPLLREAGLV